MKKQIKIKFKRYLLDFVHVTFYQPPKKKDLMYYSCNSDDND